MDCAQRRYHSRLDRQRMGFDILDGAKRLAALILAAEIEGASHAKLTQHGDVSRCEVAEVIGAEDLAPAHGPPVLAGIAAEVTKIAGAGKVQVSGRGCGHWNGRFSGMGGSRNGRGDCTEQAQLVYTCRLRGQT